MAEALDVKLRITNKDQVLKIYTDESGFSIPNVAMRALNLTAEQIKAALIEEERGTFDRPTPYTLGAPYVVKRATAKDLAVHVYLKDQAKGISESYLSPQVHGGGRRLKRFEYSLNRAGVLPDGMYVVPGPKCPRDSYGNIRAGFIVQIMAYFQAFKTNPGKRNKNTTDLKKEKLAKGTKRKQGMEYFILNQHGKRLGIFRRTSFTFGAAIDPMLFFTKQPQYRKLLRWDETAARVASENWARNFEAAQKDLI